jgi:formylglycine-generating enzyme required for sulfatase activity
MVFVEGGEFEMGDFGWKQNDDPTNLCTWPCGMDPQRMGNISMYGDDDFVHPVKLSSYHLSKYQVMLQDFDLYFVARGEPLFDTEFRKREDLQFRYQPNLPAPTKSWQEAKDYCGWIGELSGYQVDLPTEAQWEFAARNRGQYVAFATDNGSLNYGRNFPDPDETRTFPVDRFLPNPLGIYNLSGNAIDWVNDWYDKDYYRKSPVNNPSGPESGVQKVARGSTVSDDPVLGATTVRRYPDNPVRGDYYPGTGMRCAIQSEKPL